MAPRKHNEVGRSIPWLFVRNGTPTGTFAHYTALGHRVMPALSCHVMLWWCPNLFQRGIQMAFESDPRCNRLLAALPEAEWPRWREHLEWIKLPLGAVLHEARGKVAHVYFPIDAVVSKLYVSEDGSSSEVALVGDECVVGTDLFMCAGSSLHRTVVIVGGQGYRLSAATLLAEFEQSKAVAPLLLRYTQALITQMAQTAVCNRHHRLDRQLSRWLLMMFDRLSGNQ